MTAAVLLEGANGNVSALDEFLIAEHERERDRDLSEKLVASIAREQILQQPELLEGYAAYEGLDVFPRLCRCLRELSRARRGDKYAIDAITTALSQIEADAIAKRSREVAAENERSGAIGA